MSEIEKCCSFKCSWCGKFTKMNDIVQKSDFMELSGWHECYFVCKKCNDKETP